MIIYAMRWCTSVNTLEYSFMPYNERNLNGTRNIVYKHEIINTSVDV